MPKTIKTARGLARFAKAPYASRRKSLPRHSFETRQKALAIFQAGGSYKNCAKTLNIPVYTARDWHRSFLIGTFRAEHGARQQSYTPEQKAEESAGAEYHRTKQGMSCVNIKKGRTRKSDGQLRVIRIRHGNSASDTFFVNNIICCKCKSL